MNKYQAYTDYALQTMAIKESQNLPSSTSYNTLIKNRRILDGEISSNLSHFENDRDDCGGVYNDTKVGFTDENLVVRIRPYSELLDESGKRLV